MVARLGKTNMVYWYIFWKRYVLATKNDPMKYLIISFRLRMSENGKK